MALLCHFFSLQLVDDEQRPGCVSLEAVAVTAGSGIDSTLRPDTKGCWSSGWELLDLVYQQLGRVMARMAVFVGGKGDDVNSGD